MDEYFKHFLIALSFFIFFIIATGCAILSCIGWLLHGWWFVAFFMVCMIACYICGIRNLR